MIINYYLANIQIFQSKEQTKNGDEKSIQLEYTRLHGDELQFKAQARRVFDILKGNQYLMSKFADFEFIAAGGFGLVFKAKKRINLNKQHKIYEEKELENNIAFKFMANDENAKREISIMKKLFLVSAKMLMARNIQVFRRYEIMSKQQGMRRNSQSPVNSETCLDLGSEIQLQSSISEQQQEKAPFIMIEMSKAAYSLDSAITNRKKYKKPYFIFEIQKILSDILQSLFLMHIQGIVHLDIKPQNILYVEELNRYILSDFGCSIELNSIDFENSKLSTDDIIGYTPQYTDPNILNQEYFNPFKSDIWSVGVILLEILSVGQDFDLIKILKQCQNEEDVQNQIFKTYSYNMNGQQIYCPNMKNFIENDNHLEMFLQWNENKRWNILEILVETQNNSIIYPFYIPFNYSVLNSQLFSFLASEQPSSQSKIKTKEGDKNEVIYDEADCPYLYRMQQHQKANIYLSEGELIQGWKYRGFVKSNHGLENGGLYTHSKRLSKDGKGTLVNSSNKIIFQGTYDRDLPTGNGTFVISNICERKGVFTGIPYIDQQLKNINSETLLNDIEKIVYEGEFDNGQMCNGKIMYIHEKKGSYEIKRRFRQYQQIIECAQRSKVVSCLDLKSKHMQISLKCYRLSDHDKIFYISSRMYPFQIYKSLRYQKNDTIDQVMLNIKSRIIDSDTKFQQTLTTQQGYQFFFEQSLLIYAYFVDIFRLEFYQKFLKSTTIQDISSQYSLFDLYYLYESKIAESVIKSTQYVKRFKAKGKISHDKMCNYDFYKLYDGILPNLDSFCDNRKTDFQNFKEFGLNKQIKYFDLNNTIEEQTDTDDEQINKDKQNDVVAYEYLDLKNMSRIGMYFNTNNYFEKYLSNSFNTLEYLNISFDSGDVQADFTVLKNLKILKKLKIVEATANQISQFFANLNCKTLKTLHLGKFCEYDKNTVEQISQSNFCSLTNFKYYNYDKENSHFIEEILKQSKNIQNLTKICLKGHIRPECCTIISKIFKQLEILKLSYCYMNDECVAQLTGLKKLEQLSLNSNIITDDGLKPIYENLPNLKILKLNISQNLTQIGLYFLCKNLKKLEILEFKNYINNASYYSSKANQKQWDAKYQKDNTDEITWQDILYETENLHSLKLNQLYEECFKSENNYYRIRNITPEYFRSIAVLKLTDIDLSDIMEEFLKYFLCAKGVSNAIKLVINPKINQISDEIALCILSSRYTQLQHLSLSNCYNLSSKSILALLQNKSIQKTIKEIYLNNTEFDDTCAKYLIKSISLFSNLQIISVKNCLELTQDTSKDFKKQLKQVKITVLN